MSTVKKREAELLSVFFLVVAVLVFLHQLATYGVGFELSDLHHETWIIASFALALGLYWGSRSKSR